MTVLKKSFYFLILLVIMCLVTIASIFYFIDPNKLKPVLIEEVKNKTGGEAEPMI